MQDFSVLQLSCRFRKDFELKIINYKVRIGTGKTGRRVVFVSC